ncbi:MAG: NADH-quinone oxidoreductase subunit G, partial [Alphaproteobacteria bacterium]|nr:NADH-quinone oxidoreductase subunit G [Alphaproteobacteria bacterium]
VYPPGEAREDWTVLRAFSELTATTLPYDTLDAVRARMTEIAPSFGAANSIAAAEWQDFGSPGDMSGDAFASPVDDFYTTDVISRASDTMAECSALFVTGAHGKTGTDG